MQCGHLGITAKKPGEARALWKIDARTVFDFEKTLVNAEISHRVTVKTVTMQLVDT